MLCLIVLAETPFQSNPTTFGILSAIDLIREIRYREQIPGRFQFACYGMKSTLSSLENILIKGYDV
jgi:hypothetical protein